MTNTDIPNPGSDEAVEQNCACSILDNAYGRGYLGVEGRFVINAECPLHGVDSNWE